MQFQVPQNIDMEDKIIGPLTLIQFLYLLAGGIICYLFFLGFGSSFVFWIVSVPIGAVALALAFLKIQDQPVSYFIKAGLIFLSRPKKRIWQRQGIQPKVIQAGLKKTPKQPLVIPKRQIEKSQLEQLAQMLDTQKIQPQGGK